MSDAENTKATYEHSPFQLMLAFYQAGYRQTHECSCGPASLALAAHSIGLKLLSEQTWLDERFKRWVPKDEFLKRGMALHEAQLTTELVFAGELEVSLRRAYPENMDLFYKDLQAADERSDTAIVMNFAQDHILERQYLNQGNPHYSPIVGLRMKDKTIVVADVDSEILKPYETTIERAFQSMAIINPAFQLPRGWLTLRRRKNV